MHLGARSLHLFPNQLYPMGFRLHAHEASLQIFFE
jgi:hypothetical protein